MKDVRILWIMPNKKGFFMSEGILQEMKDLADKVQASKPSVDNILADIAAAIQLYQDVKGKIDLMHPSVISIFKLLLSEL